MDVKWIDVETAEEFAFACDGCIDPIPIFDGYGSHKQESQIGTIRVGGDDVTVWAFRSKISIPPIVLLSCCDACPSDRSHASTANGFLAMGAKAVFGAMFPVDAVKSGLLIARLLYRITSTARWLTSQSRASITWAQIVAAQVRAAYVSEVLREVGVNNNISEDAAFVRKQADILELINLYNPAWINVFHDAIRQFSGWDADHLKSFINNMPLQDCLYYIHWGTPEKIVFSFDGKYTD